MFSACLAGADPTPPAGPPSAYNPMTPPAPVAGPVYTPAPGYGGYGGGYGSGGDCCGKGGYGYGGDCCGKSSVCGDDCCSKCKGKLCCLIEKIKYKLCFWKKCCDKGDYGGYTQCDKGCGGGYGGGCDKGCGGNKGIHINLCGKCCDKGYGYGGGYGGDCCGKASVCGDCCNKGGYAAPVCPQAAPAPVCQQVQPCYQESCCDKICWKPGYFLHKCKAKLCSCLCDKGNDGCHGGCGTAAMPNSCGSTVIPPAPGAAGPSSPAPTSIPGSAPAPGAPGAPDGTKKPGEKVGSHYNLIKPSLSPVGELPRTIDLAPF
jgi:hypothetical protein